MINQKKPYNIQAVSRKMTLPITTLRYYEEIGLLEQVQRSSKGHRLYDETDLRRLDLIKKLRLAGMSLEQIRDFVVLYKAGKHTTPQRREILTCHREAVQARIDELVEVLRFIDQKIEAYYTEETASELVHQQEV